MMKKSLLIQLIPTPPMLPNFLAISSKVNSLNMNNSQNSLIKNLVRNNLHNILNKTSNENDERSLETNLIIGHDKMNLNSKNDEEIIYFSNFKNVTHVLQNGPSCGLAALSMAESMLLQENSAKLLEEEILSKAKIMNITKNGEIFSTDFMRKLAEELFGLKSEIISNNININEKKITILHHLLNCQSAILIPYDRDHNNEPCKKNGKSAHWCLINGIVIGIKSKEKSSILSIVDYLEKTSCLLQENKTFDNIIHINKPKLETIRTKLDNSSPCATLDPFDLDNERVSHSNIRQANEDIISKLKYNHKIDPQPESSEYFSKENLENISNKDVTCSENLIQKNINQILDEKHISLNVYTVQGKSLRTHLWSLDDLLESNIQLLEVDPNLLGSVFNSDSLDVGIINDTIIEESQIILPSGSIKYGLCGKFIILDC